eukprot:CAMPEP_0114563856 /NCGR_PEP_ID=MMETSP0114-20121206/13363_1 /TAXON_ID=31324 /ORGANISM="Goniomonas sp, Strain m" /LENGTH=49 /DNA_ID= /DNA_START= /DNA_END= /DNA_ORIENTATION=
MGIGVHFGTKRQNSGSASLARPPGLGDNADAWGMLLRFGECSPGSLWVR